MSKVTLSEWHAAQAHEGEFWDGYARTYARFPQILLDHLAKLRDVGEFVADELADSRVRDMLEVGVGPLGIGVLGVFGSGRRFIAVDPLPRVDLDLRDEALERYVRSLRDRVDYQCAQGESLRFGNDSFDFVCCHNVIDHAHEPEAILSEAYRVLRPGGRLFLTLNTFSHLGRLKFETLRRLRPDRLIFVCHPHSFRHADVIEILMAIGFVITRQDGGRRSITGRGRLSKFLCEKPR